MQILNVLITALVVIAVGVVAGFFLLLALNGYTGGQADPGLILYVVWVLFFALLTAGLSFLSAKYLIVKKSFSAIAAVAISAPIFIIVGGVAVVVGMFASVFLIEALR
jgi:hypothetical protein